jgi:hypothetical protein
MTTGVDRRTRREKRLEARRAQTPGGGGGKDSAARSDGARAEVVVEEDTRKGHRRSMRMLGSCIWACIAGNAAVIGRTAGRA